MIRARPLVKFLAVTLPMALGAVTALVLLTALAGRSAQNPVPPKSPEILSHPPAVNAEAALTTPHPKGEPKNPNLENTKADAAKLSALADQLRDELKKMNVNVLSLDVLQKTEEVEKLARKIKGEANGY